MSIDLEVVKKVARETTEKCIDQNEKISDPLVKAGILTDASHQLSKEKIEELLKIVENVKKQRDQGKSKK